MSDIKHYGPYNRFHVSGTHRHVHKGMYMKGPRKGQACVCTQRSGAFRKREALEAAVSVNGLQQFPALCVAVPSRPRDSGGRRRGQQLRPCQRLRPGRRSRPGRRLCRPRSIASPLRCPPLMPAGLGRMASRAMAWTRTNREVQLDLVGLMRWTTPPGQLHGAGEHAAQLPERPSALAPTVAHRVCARFE